MKPNPNHPSTGRRIARVIIWTTFGVVLFVRFVVMRDERPFQGFRVRRDEPAAQFWPQQEPRFRRPATRVQPPAAEVPNDLFRIQIEIAPKDVSTLRGYFWNGWRGRQQDRPEVLATVREGKIVCTNVAVHLKGAAGSFRPFDDKPALTLNFSKHAPGQRFHEYSKFSLNNSVQDPTFLSEAICRELCNAAGVPTPRADWATVLINGRDLGLYVLIEGYNKDFLRHHFKNVKGNLYDGGFCQEVNGALNVNSGDHPEDQSDLQRLVAAASEPVAATRWNRLKDVLDIDRFITLAAMEVMMCHWDGYCLNRNNYRVFHDLESDKMVFMPHGLDQMFDWPPQHRFPTDGPIQPAMRGLVAAAVLNTREGGREYFARMSVLQTNLFQPDRVIGRVHELEKRIRPTLLAYDPSGAQWHEAAVASLCERIAQRIQSVTEQLNRPRETLPFDGSGAAYLTNWTKFATAQQPALALDQSEEYGHRLLHLSSMNRGGTGSWRMRALLPSGLYRFEGRAKASADAAGGRLSLRLSGARPAPQVISGTDWTPLSYSFSVDGFQAEVWLVCEFSGNRGEVWFDLDSLRLVRE